MPDWFVLFLVVTFLIVLPAVFFTLWGLESRAGRRAREAEEHYDSGMNGNGGEIDVEAG